MGPIVGGFVVDSYLGWRWIFWIMMIIASVGYVLMALFLPETYSPVILKAKVRQVRLQTSATVLTRLSIGKTSTENRPYQ